MGLFENAGRQFERLKQNVTSAAEESAGYECATCGTRFFTEQEQCPECDAEEIVATTSTAEGPSSATDSSAASPSEDSPESTSDDSAAPPADADGS